MAKDTKRIKSAEILVFLRKKHNYKQRQVAELLGIPAERYRKYETTTPPPFSVAIKLGEIYEVSIDYILGNSTAEHSEPSNKAPQSSMKFSAPLLYNEPETDFDLSGLPEDVKMLVEGYLNSSDTKKQALLILATEP